MAFDTEQDKPQQGSMPTIGPAAWGEGQKDFETGYRALGKVQQIAGQTPDIWSQIQKANEATTQQGLQNLRRQAATTLYANRGSLGGGGGLAAMQQANATSGLAQTQAALQANAQRAALGQEAQQAGLGAQNEIAHAAGQRYLLLQNEQGARQNRINIALAAAEDAAKHAISGFGMFVTDADRKKQADAIRQKVLATESDPAVIEAVNNFINNLGSYNNPGAIGV